MDGASRSRTRTTLKFGRGAACSFRIPSYYTLLVRSLSVLEGIALASDPNYKVGRYAPPPPPRSPPPSRRKAPAALPSQPDARAELPFPRKFPTLCWQT